MRIKKAVTIVEVLVSAIILASVVVGVVATFVSVRRNVGKGSERVTAANLVRGVLDPLYAEVRADMLTPNTNNTYASSDHALAVGAKSLVPTALDDVLYSRGYEVTTTDGDYLSATAQVSFTVKGD